MTRRIETIRIYLISIAAMTLTITGCAHYSVNHHDLLPTNTDLDGHFLKKYSGQDENSSIRSSSLKCAKTIFSCRTENNKHVSICDLGETLSYSFGRHGATPEKSLSVARKEASTYQWNGIGRWYYYTVTIPNGSTAYTVYTSTDRLTDEHEFEAGVIVEFDGNEIARIKCREPIVHELEGIDLKDDK